MDSIPLHHKRKDKKIHLKISSRNKFRDHCILNLFLILREVPFTVKGEFTVNIEIIYS
ncbi:MAG: hypothetical protein ACJAX4_004075 [Clostridium sp.]|jgi:hypothetical protein